MDRARFSRAKNRGRLRRRTNAEIDTEVEELMLQVELALENGPFTLLILGGAHDLSASVKRLPGADCEYLRVTMARYQEYGANGPR